MKRVVLFTLMIVMLSISTFAEEVAPPWKIEGSYAEGCSCAVGCPCVFLSLPTMEKCQAVIAFHVNEGNYGPTSLKGLSVAVAVDTSTGLTMAQGNWASIAYYVDSKASPEQREALEKIFVGMFSPLGPNSLGVKSVPISYELTQDKKASKVSIPEILELHVQLVPGVNPVSPSKIVNPPFHFLPELLVAKSIVYHYKDHNLAWSHPERSAFMSHFEYSNPPASGS